MNNAPKKTAKRKNVIKKWQTDIYLVKVWFEL